MRALERGVLLMGAVLLIGGCENTVPTTGDRNEIPVESRSVELRLPFEAFASDFAEYSGFGRLSGLPGSVVAHAWRGDTDIHAMYRFLPPPRIVQVLPPGGTATQPDSLWVPSYGVVTLRLDTLEVRGTPPLQLHAERILSRWDPSTAGWELAVDTVGGRVSWGEAGGGPVLAIDSRSWTRAQGDTISFTVDSATVSAWARGEPLEQGLRIRGSTPGMRLPVVSADLRIFVRPSIRPDTLVQIIALGVEVTTLAPSAPASVPGAFRVGGAPGWRATFRMQLPSTVGPEFNACLPGECPLELLPERLVYAGLELHSRATVPAGLQPLDTMVVNLRPVLAPDYLPRSPIDIPVHAAPRFLAPQLFSSSPNSKVEIPMTRYIRDLLRDQREGGTQVPRALALVPGLEPWALDLASFHAPGDSLGPTLRLILTTSEGIPLP